MTSDWPGERARHGGVDEVGLPVVPGRLWLCGKHYVGPDPEGALASVGADRVVCLCERHELADRFPAYVEWLATDPRAIWWPVPDLHAPALPALLDMLSTLGAAVQAGQSVLLHCGAGIGRAGTVATALLMTLGLDQEAALAAVARQRPMAGPEAGGQTELLAAVARHLESDPGPTGQPRGL